MDQKNKNEFEPFNDEWLTRALRARSRAEARPELEERILAHLTSEQVSQPQRRWRWMPGLAVAFALLLIVLVGRHFLRVTATPNSTNDKVAHNAANQNLPLTNPLERKSPLATKSSKAKSLKLRTDRSVARAAQPL